MPHLRPCAHPGCRTLIPHNGPRRCAAHPLEPRGYAHQQARAQVLARATACATCGEQPTRANPLTLGHRIARANGGTLHPANLIAQCKRCNLTQGSRDIHNDDNTGRVGGAVADRGNATHDSTPPPLAATDYRLRGFA